MKTKKGFTLLTTVSVMLLVICISSFIVVMVTSFFKIRSTSKNDFESKLMLFQIAENYKSKQRDEFISFYENFDYEKKIIDDIVFLSNDENFFEITQNNDIEVFIVKFLHKDKIQLTMKKLNGNIIFWKYGGE